MTDTLVEPNPAAGDGAPHGWVPESIPESIPESRRGEGIRSPRVYMTSDLRVATGLTRTHLDFYLREGLVRPSARAESGYLLFDEAELTTLRTVLRWRQEGIGLKRIRERLGR